MTEIVIGSRYYLLSEFMYRSIFFQCSSITFLKDEKIYHLECLWLLLVLDLDQARQQVGPVGLGQQVAQQEPQQQEGEVPRAPLAG